MVVFPASEFVDVSEEIETSFTEASLGFVVLDASVSLASSDVDDDEHAVNPAGIAIASETKAATRAAEIIRRE